MVKTFRHTETGNKVWFISDLHLGHDKDFVLKPRGFNSVEEMNKTLIDNINLVVDELDTLYILGDLVLCPIEEARYWLSQIKCLKVVVIIGNHDTDNRLQLYNELGFAVQFGGRLKYGKYHFFLSHYPTLTENDGEEKLMLANVNIYGHTHQTWNWCSDRQFAFCVCPEANNNFPIEINEIIDNIRENITLKNKHLI
jgi:calcineurin-like phosphoesterase family protein